MEEKVVVEVKNVSMNYHTLEGETEAIKELSLKIFQGEFISIIGPSGCGKSTLLSLLAGLLSPSRGEVLIKGEPVSGPNSFVGYMAQRDQLFPWRNILQNVLIGLEVQNKLTEQAQQKARDLLITYGLGDFIHHYPYQLSGGMRQRAALIRTLAINPEILLLDEPFSALDYQTRLLVADEVKAIITKEQKTSILVTHDIAEAISMSDRIVVLSRRPATVKSIHQVVLSGDCPSPLRRRESPEFRYYFNQIWKELRDDET